jgi:hypothetical protein
MALFNFQVSLPNPLNAIQNAIRPLNLAGFLGGGINQIGGGFRPSGSGGTNIINTGFSIDDFRMNFSKNNEVSKTDKFDVYFTIPTQVSSGSSYGMRELSLQCEVSELPGRDVSMIEYRHYAFIKRIPHINQYGQITFTFYCTGALLEKKLFDRWMDLMIPVDTGLVNYSEDNSGSPLYETTIAINQYDQSRNLIYTVNLISALPISVSNMGQNWADDSIHRLSVTFAFLKWTSDQTTASTNQVPSSDAPVTNFTNRFTPATTNPANQPVNSNMGGTDFGIKNPESWDD